MALSWNEIKKRAIEFSKSWEGVEREKAEAQTFWNEFFEVFGQTRRKVAVLEQEVKRLDESKGYIDLFWPKVLLAEAKSKGKDLVKAKDQAISYLHGIADTELPKYILTSDFETLSLLDLESGESWQFKVSKLHENIKLFSFIAGYAKTDFRIEDPVNIKAAELMGKLHDSLFEAGYFGHNLEVFLVRVLFCLFADDTGIFDKGIFSDFVVNKTKEDGTDIGPQIAQLFQLLNTPEEDRLKNLDEELLKFPYVNGKLYEETIPMTAFDSTMRKSLLDCCSFDWSRISPAVFGSLFQSVMDQKQRRNLGAHYTSEENILKLIRPLFLDDLWSEFRKVKHNKARLNDFHNKLSKLKFLDPACGCGNFLVVTYRELRLLELEILKSLHNEQIRSGALGISLDGYLKLNVDQMYGIEIEEFPAKIAEVAMWLVDHQMNIKISEELGQYYVRLPLRKSANIVNGNALRLDWEEIVSKNELSYILGNPPFVGKKEQTKIQKEELLTIFNGVKGAGVLDFVTCWYIRSAAYIQNTTIKVAFVSTNSISQGEQVGILWKELFEKYNIKIHFAHRTFQWNSEARGKAAVHVVVIGFANFDIENKRIFEYEDIKGQPHEAKVKNINPFLVEGKDITVENRRSPICNVPEMNYGSMPIDEGNLILTDEEKKEVLNDEPMIISAIKKYTGGDEFINNKERWCLWLENIEPSVLKNSKFIIDRVEKTKRFRLNSNREATNRLAERPMLFGEIRQPSTSYIIIPKVSSESRKYIPMGILESTTIVSGSALVIPNGDLLIFGIMTSLMHMSWMKSTCGRMKSDFQYSASIVYNNFPWPENISDNQKKLVEEKVQQVLDIRKEFPDSTLADLYNPLTMPPKLLKAHKELDSAVDKCYRVKAFKDERERIEFLFEKYEDLIKNEKN